LNKYASCICYTRWGERNSVETVCGSMIRSVPYSLLRPVWDKETSCGCFHRYCFEGKSEVVAARPFQGSSVLGQTVGRRHCPNVFSQPLHSGLDVRSLKCGSGNPGSCCSTLNCYLVRTTGVEIADWRKKIDELDVPIVRLISVCAEAAFGSCRARSTHLRTQNKQGLRALDEAWEGVGFFV